jgi:hypothetical protein
LWWSHQINWWLMFEISVRTVCHVLATILSSLWGL